MSNATNISINPLEIVFREETIDRDTHSLGFCGLSNQGNTCYMNSILQCLSHTKWLREYLFFDRFAPFADKTKQQYMMLNELNKLIRAMWYRNGVVVPKNFLHYLQYLSVKIGSGKFAGYNQNDSSELLAFILDTVSDATARPFGTEASEASNDFAEAVAVWKRMFQTSYSDIIREFYGQHHTVIQCSLCKTTSVNYDPFSILNVPVVTGALTDCLREYIREEHLSGDNQYYCEKCGEHTDAARHEGILKTARHLVITLKRFHSHEHKNNQYVHIDPHAVLDMSDYLHEHGAHSPHTQYRLYAISNHVGGVGGGHYYSYIRRHGQWYEFNDNHVTTIHAEKVVTENAYVLFYEAI